MRIVELRRGGSEEEGEQKLRAIPDQRLFLKVIEMNRLCRLDQPLPR